MVVDKRVVEINVSRREAVMKMVETVNAFGDGCLTVSNWFGKDSKFGKALERVVELENEMIDLELGNKW